MGSSALLLGQFGTQERPISCRSYQIHNVHGRLSHLGIATLLPLIIFVDIIRMLPRAVSRVRWRGVHVLLRGPRALPAVLAVPLRLRLPEGLPGRIPLRRLPGDVHARRRCKAMRNELIKSTSFMIYIEVFLNRLTAETATATGSRARSPSSRARSRTGSSPTPRTASSTRTARAARP